MDELKWFDYYLILAIINNQYSGIYTLYYIPTKSLIFNAFINTHEYIYLLYKKNSSILDCRKPTLSWSNIVFPTFLLPNIKTLILPFYSFEYNKHSYYPNIETLHVKDTAMLKYSIFPNVTKIIINNSHQININLSILTQFKKLTDIVLVNFNTLDYGISNRIFNINPLKKYNVKYIMPPYDENDETCY
jgi:hypothetical protein